MDGLCAKIVQTRDVLSKLEAKSRRLRGKAKSNVMTVHKEMHIERKTKLEMGM